MLKSSTLKHSASNLLIPYESLTDDQVLAINHLYENDHTLLIANMGGGKTVVSLTALSELLDEGVIKRALVIAPLKVANAVWSSEAGKWEHLQPLTDEINVCTGTAAHRKKMLKKRGKITIVNFEAIPWLVDQPEMKDFDALIVD